jgi:ATP-dependent DNA helicase RecG
MPDSISTLLTQLNELDERDALEAKRSADELGKSALETISAFANEPALGGGTLLFGVSEVGGSYVATGVADPGKLAAELASQCASAFNRPLRPRIAQESIAGKVVIAATIPEAAASDKPIFIASRGMQHGTYRRISGTDQRATEDDLRALFGAAVGEAHEDTLLADATMADLDPEVVATYRRGLLEVSPGTELRDAGDEALVQAVGGARRESGVLVPTVAGLLLFGRALSLRRLFPSIRVDYVRVPGTQWVPDPDRRFDTVEIRAPLLAAFHRAYAAISDDLPRTFLLEPGSPERKERLAIPESVIREALVNALTHRSYRVASAVQVLRFKDRIELRNPGCSLVEDDRLGDPGSFTRNPRIADVFREMRLAENKGTGIAAMKRAMKVAGLTPPIFKSDRRSDLFIATLWLHNLLGPEETEWLQRFATLGLSDAQAQALVIARRTGEVRNSTLRGVTDLDPLEARRELHGLRAHGLLRMESNRGGAYYVLTAKADFNGIPVQDRGELVADRGESVPDRGELPAQRGEVPAQRGEVAGEPSDGPPPVPEDLRRRLNALGPRSRQPLVRTALLDLCALGFWRPSELAAALGLKSAEKLVERHITPMLKAGQLVRKYPDVPQHPDQAYRASLEARERKSGEPDE